MQEMIKRLLTLSWSEAHRHVFFLRIKIHLRHTWMHAQTHTHGYIILWLKMTHIYSPSLFPRTPSVWEQGIRLSASTDPSSTTKSNSLVGWKQLRYASICRGAIWEGKLGEIQGVYDWHGL